MIKILMGVMILMKVKVYLLCLEKSSDLFRWLLIATLVLRLQPIKDDIM